MPTAKKTPRADGMATIYDLAEEWGLSPRTIHRLFRHCVGVMKLRAEPVRGKRQYVTLRIPRQVAERVFKEMTK